jgi:hypothetical protein
VATSEQRHAETLGESEADVADHRRVGHAEHEVGPRSGQPLQQRAADVRDVVQRPQTEAGTLERGRRHPDDLHAVANLAPRQPLVSSQDARQHTNVVLVGQRLAQLGQQVRGRLDAGPVVLVDDEQARLCGHPGANTHRPEG